MSDLLKVFTEALYNKNEDEALMVIDSCLKNGLNKDLNLLEMALQSAKIKVSTYLIQQGADVTINDYCPFRLAVGLGNLPLIELLVNQDNRCISASNYGSFCAAVTSGHLKVLKYLTEKDMRGLAANKYLALRVATYTGRRDIIKYIIDKDRSSLQYLSKEMLELYKDLI